MRTVKIHNHETNKNENIKMYTSMEVANKLGITYKSALHKIRTGELRGVKLGNGYCVSEIALRDYVL